MYLLSLSALFTLLSSTPPASPKLDSLPNLFPRNSIHNQLHRQAQLLRLPISRLVIEKQYILEPNSRPLLQGLEMLDLAPGVYLQPSVKHINRNLLL